MWLLQQERTRSHRGLGRLLLLVRPDPRRLRNLKELLDRQAPRLRDNYRDSHIRHFHALRGRSGLQQFTQKLHPLVPLLQLLGLTSASNDLVYLGARVRLVLVLLLAARGRI